MGRWAEGYAAWDSVAGRSPSIPGWCRRCWPGFRSRDARGADVRAGPAPRCAPAARRISRSRHGTSCGRASRRWSIAPSSRATRPRPRELLRRIDRAPPPPPSEPAAEALRWSLRARLALLAHDTTAAVAASARAVARIPETHTANYPLTAVGPQRFLLARLLLARGDSAGAERWRRSFTGSWSVADLFYLPALDSRSALSRTRSAP